MFHENCQLEEWIRGAEAWLNEQWAELERYKALVREHLGRALESRDFGELRRIKADLAALQEDMDSGLQQFEASEAVPVWLQVRAGVFLVELDELMDTIKGAM